MSWNRALVTGASSGIGHTIARRLASAGTETVLVARDTDRLTRLAADLPAPAEVLGADLTVAADLERVAARLGDGPEVDLLVNNAGFGTTGQFWTLPFEREVDMVAVNVVAPMRLAHAALASMVPAGRGAIINISSVASVLVAPRSATYAATKAFLTSFTDSLQVELRGSGVTATAVLPGFTTTDFQRRASTTEWSDTMPSWAWTSAEEVADAALAAAAAGKAWCVPGPQYKVGVALASHTPVAVQRFIAARARR